MATTKQREVSAPITVLDLSTSSDSPVPTASAEGAGAPGKQAAFNEIAAMVRVFLRNWEDSDALPSEAAGELLGRVLTHQRLDEARRETLESGASVGRLGSVA